MGDRCCLRPVCRASLRRRVSGGREWPWWICPLSSSGIGLCWRCWAGLGEMRFHDLRHTCVTLLLNLGVPPQIVRGIVGHSDIEVTMTIYAHASLDDKRAALRKLGDALE
ncbi:tyrosine-type recombinase/integrase [Nonomuraea sp. NPDC004702]